MFHKCSQQSSLIAVLLAFSLITHQHVLGHIRPSFSPEIRNPEVSIKNVNLLDPEHDNHPHTRKGRCFFPASKYVAPQRQVWTIDPKSSLSYPVSRMSHLEASSVSLPIFHSTPFWNF